VWLARLADAQSPDAVAAITAAAVGVQQASGDTVSLITRALTDGEGLLVLDDCEHVASAVADLTLSLLKSCPRARILATSRQPLEVSGEHILRVAPLQILDDDGTDGPAVRLLIDRVRAARPGWSPDHTERRSARHICTMLDGLPLAIELAAARERVFGLSTLAGHLEHGLHVLGSPQRGSVTTHSSLTAAIAWSMEQLDPVDRAILLRLWPFEGGFTAEAVNAVRPSAPADGDTTGRAVLAVLASLVDRSVIMSDVTAGTVRYRMLETTRQFCRDTDPDPAGTRSAHAAWLRRFVADETSCLVAPNAVQNFRAIHAELPNIRVGIAHDLHHSPTDALRTCAALEFAWPSLGVLTEGLRLIRAALAASPDAPVADRVNGLLAISIDSYHAGNPQESVRRADDALALLDADGVPSVLTLKALVYRGGGASELGDTELVRDTLERLAIESARQPAPDWIRCSVMLCAAGLDLMQGRCAHAETVLASARTLAQHCGFAWVEGMTHLMLARSLLRDPTAPIEDARRAASALAQALSMFELQNNLIDELAVVYAGAHALLRLGQADTAITLRAAVAEHIARLGVTMRRFQRLSGRDPERRLTEAHLSHDALAPEQAGRGLSWTDMLALFRRAMPT
jgi:predicted ATPase